jgi:hypothetical protein
MQRHLFEADPNSAEGNCWCGHMRENEAHPHLPLNKPQHRGTCRCGRVTNGHDYGGSPRMSMWEPRQEYYYTPIYTTGNIGNYTIGSPLGTLAF